MLHLSLGVLVRPQPQHLSCASVCVCVCVCVSVYTLQLQGDVSAAFDISSPNTTNNTPRNVFRHLHNLTHSAHAQRHTDEAETSTLPSNQSSP